MTDQTPADLTPAVIVEQLPNFFVPEKAANMNATIQFDLSGDDAGQWWIKVADGQATSGQGAVEAPNMTMLASSGDFVKIMTGQLDGTAAFMSGKLKIKGDMGIAMKMQSLFRRPGS